MSAPLEETTSVPSPGETAPAAVASDPANVPALEVDDDDNDSSYGEDDAASSTASIASSILKYREENGRTYHAYKNGAYILPNDDRENDRLDLQHALFGLTLGDQALFGAPIPKEQTLHRVLDVGTGTGIWAMDFGDAFPASQVIGLDLSPIQPRFVPPNVSFEIDDLEAEWTFTKPFDFIFERMTVSAFADPKKYFERAYANLVPGGWVECLDICWPISSDDGTLKKDSDLAKWGDLMDQGYQTLGRSGYSPNKFKAQMEAAGFTNVKEVVYKWPTNPKWPKDEKFKELGMWTSANIVPGLEGLSLAIFTRLLGWTPEEVQVFLPKVKSDLKNKNVHAYFPIYNVYGQKPVAASTE